jgi:hypothetical protein
MVIGSPLLEVTEHIALTIREYLQFVERAIQIAISQGTCPPMAVDSQAVILYLLQSNTYCRQGMTLGIALAQGKDVVYC